MDDLYWRLVDFFQAMAAGLLVGGTYGLMCVGLGIIFGVMRVVNFAHGDFLMLGMYAAFYLVTGFGTLAFLGPYVGPIVGALLAGPIVFVVGWVLHKTLIARVTGARVMSAEAEGHYAQIILTLGIALVLANGGLILFGSTPLSVQTPLSRESWEIGPIFFNQARTVGFVIAVAVRDRALPLPRRAPASARRCAPPPTIRSRRLTSASTSTARTASRSGSASASRRSPAGCSRCRSRSSPISASTSSS